MDRHMNEHCATRKAGQSEPRMGLVGGGGFHKSTGTRHSSGDHWQSWQPASCWHPTQYLNPAPHSQFCSYHGQDTLEFYTNDSASDSVSMLTARPHTRRHTGWARGFLTQEELLACAGSMDGSSSNADDGADRIDGVGALQGARVGSCGAGSVVPECEPYLGAGGYSDAVGAGGYSDGGAGSCSRDREEHVLSRGACGYSGGAGRGPYPGAAGALPGMP